MKLKKFQTVERGTALLLVAWILLIMGSVALFLLYRSSAEWALVNSLSRRLKMQEIATDWLRQLISELNNDETDWDDKFEGWFLGGRAEREFVDNKNTYLVTIIIEDEGSKPNINYIYSYQNLEVFVPKELSTAPLQDWIDRNEEPQNDGAENPFYQSLNPPYKSRDGFLSTMEELKQIKDGDKLYPLLAPYFTVFGKANPNIINSNTFSNLLYSHGLKDYTWEKIMTEFGNLTRSASRTHFFINANEFSRIGATDLDRDKMAPLFRFDGFCNINFISLDGLEFIFREAELNKEAAKPITELRDNDPFKDMDRVKQVLKEQAAPKNEAILADYFTIVTTLVRYKIWVKFQQSTFYMDTVWERYRVSNAKTKWQSHPLSWRYLLNNEAPEIPAPEEKEKKDEENKGQ